jgi:hypothetical protein
MCFKFCSTLGVELGEPPKDHHNATRTLPLEPQQAAPRNPAHNHLNTATHPEARLPDGAGLNAQLPTLSSALLSKDGGALEALIRIFSGFPASATSKPTTAHGFSPVVRKAPINGSGHETNGEMAGASLTPEHSAAS